MSLDILLQRVALLGQTEHQEILNILSCSGHISTTRNNNGVFIDLGTVPESLLEEIRLFVDYCHHNKKHIDDYNNRLVECRLSQDFDRLPMYTATKNDGGGDVSTPDSASNSQPVAISDELQPRESKVVEYTTDTLHPVIEADTERDQSVSRKSAVARFQQSKKRFNRRKGINSLSGYGGLLEPEPYLLNNKSDLSTPV